MIRVVVVDDHALYRRGLVQVLGAEGDIKVVGEGESAAEAVELVRQSRPDMLLLDVSMEDNGIERISDVLEASESTRIVMVSASDDVADLGRANQAGASAYVLKGVTGPEMRSIVRSIHAQSR